MKCFEIPPIKGDKNQSLSSKAATLRHVMLRGRVSVYATKKALRSGRRPLNNQISRLYQHIGTTSFSSCAKKSAFVRFILEVCQFAGINKNFHWFFALFLTAFL